MLQGCDLVVHGAVLFGGLTGGALCGRAELIGQLSRTSNEPFGRADCGWEGTGALHPVLAAAALATLHEATPAALHALEQRAARLRSMLGTTGLGPAVRLPAGSDPDQLRIRRVLVDREWAWLSTATDDDDVAEAVEKLRR